MKLTLTALTVAASLMASGASAFDPADVQKRKIRMSVSDVT